MKTATSLLLAGFGSLIIAVIGFATHIEALGVTFMVVMVAFGVAAFVVAFVFYSRAKKWRDQQRAASGLR